MNENKIQTLPRPIAIWVSAISLLYSGMGISIINAFFIFNGIPTLLPPVDPVTQTNLLYTLLGLGAMRSYDKATIAKKDK